MWRDETAAPSYLQEAALELLLAAAHMLRRAPAAMMRFTALRIIRRSRSGLTPSRRLGDISSSSRSDRYGYRGGIAQKRLVGSPGLAPRADGDRRAGSCTAWPSLGNTLLPGDRKKTINRRHELNGSVPNPALARAPSSRHSYVRLCFEHLRSLRFVSAAELRFGKVYSL